jgi:hypothetical protein
MATDNMSELRRFSLRALFLCITVTAAIFGWIGYQRDVVEQQTRAISRLQQLGAVPNLVDFRNERAYTVTPAQPPRFTFLNRVFGKGYYIYAPQINLTSASLTAETVRSMFPYLRQLRMKEGLNVAGKTNIALMMSPKLFSDPHLLSDIKQQVPQCEGYRSVPSANAAYQ